MVDMYEYRKNKIDFIEDLIRTGGLESYEITDKIKESGKENPQTKKWTEKMVTWRDMIYNSDSADFIDRVHDFMYNLIMSVMTEKYEKKKQQINDDAKKEQDWWKDYYRKINENNEWWKKYYNNEHPWQKDGKKREEENKKKFDEPIKNNPSDSDKKSKRGFINDIEMDLVKKNVSGERLSQRLGVSDWKEKINGAVDFNEVLSRRSDLWDIIRELKTQDEREFTCASCGEKKEKYYKYPLEDGKKYCSLECWNKGEKNNKKNDGTGGRGKFGVSNMSEFFAWMKKMGVTKISFDFNTNQVVIECNGDKKLSITDSGLSPALQEELTTQLKSTKEPITFSEVSSEFEKGKGKNNNALIIGSIVVIGVIFIAIISIVIHKSRKKDY